MKHRCVYCHRHLPQVLDHFEIGVASLPPAGPFITWVQPDPSVEAYPVCQECLWERRLTAAWVSCLPYVEPPTAESVGGSGGHDAELPPGAVRAASGVVVTAEQLERLATLLDWEGREHELELAIAFGAQWFRFPEDEHFSELLDFVGTLGFSVRKWPWVVHISCESAAQAPERPEAT